MINLTKIIESLGRLVSQFEANKFGSRTLVVLSLIAVGGVWVFKH